MAGLKDAFRQRKEVQKARPPQPTIMVKDPRTGETMTKVVIWQSINCYNHFRFRTSMIVKK